jgi:hypothetical protein
MTSIPDILSLAMTLATLGLIVAAVMKIFQMASDTHEMKEILKDMRRISQGLGNASPFPAAATPTAALPAAGSPGLAPLANALPQGTPAGALSGAFAQPPTPEELVRAVHAQHFGDDDFPL